MVGAHPGFGFTSLTIEPVETTRIEPSPGGAFGKGERIVNEPYKQPFTQAGWHPWGLTTTLELATEVWPVSGTAVEQFGRNLFAPVQEPKDVVGDLPPGLLGDPQAVPRCPLSLATTASAGLCPGATQIGVWRVRHEGNKELLGPIVNVVPEPGQSAEFALENHGAHAIITPLLTAHLIRTHES